MIFPPISLLSHHHIDSFLSHRSLYNVLTLCDKHGNRPSRQIVRPGLIAKENPTPVCTCIPQMTSWPSSRSCLCLADNAKPTQVRLARASPPSPCFAQFVQLWAFHAIPKCVVLLGFCKVPIPKVSYTSVTVLLSSRQTMFLPCEVSYQHFRLH